MQLAYLPQANSQVPDQYFVKQPIIYQDTLYCWDSVDVVRLGNAYKYLNSLKKQKDALVILYELGQIDKATYEQEIKRLNNHIKITINQNIVVFIKGFFVGIITSLLTYLIIN